MLVAILGVDVVVDSGRSVVIVVAGDLVQIPVSQEKGMEMSYFEIGDRVQTVDEVVTNVRPRVGVVTAIRKELLQTKLTVRLADGAESTFEESELEVVPIMFADMIFDTDVSPSGLRGSAVQRHMRFVCREFDIHLKLSGSDEDKSLYGQVTADGVKPERSLITLLFDNKPYAAIAGDSLGEFQFVRIPSRRVALEVVVPFHRIIATFQV